MRRRRCRPTNGVATRSPLTLTMAAGFMGECARAMTAAEERTGHESSDFIAKRKGEVRARGGQDLRRGVRAAPVVQETRVSLLGKNLTCGFPGAATEESVDAGV
jgi:hypothetical protein